MSDSVETFANKKTNLSLAPYLDFHAKRALYNLREELGAAYGREDHAVLECQVRRVSPRNAQRISDAVQNAMRGWIGSEAKGDSVPVDFYLNLSDLTRLWVRVDPNTHEYKARFGSHF